MNTIFTSQEEQDFVEKLLDDAATRTYNKMKPDMERAIDNKFNECVGKNIRRIDILWELVFPVKLFGVYFSARRAAVIILFLLLFLLTSLNLG